jgi:predicted dehydrogenase
MSRAGLSKLAPVRAFPALLSSAPMGFQSASSSDRVRVAICGLHNRGMDHLHGFAAVPGVEIAALCDVDENVLATSLAAMAKMGLPKPRTETDVRRLLEDPSIDAVSIATPNHWHSLIAIWACEAGKDVYVEKPCCHNLWEGRQLVLAALNHGRIVQHGTQARSKAAIREAISRLHAGAIGDLYLARGLCYKWRDTIGHTPIEPVPPGVHYDLWTGPAPLHPFTRNRFHYNWHWFWDTGNGDLGNQGIHQVDVARWGMKVGWPTRVSAIGGHFMFHDDQQTPNTLNCAFEFDQADGTRKMIEFEVRHWITPHEATIDGPEIPPPAPRSSAASHHPRLGPDAGAHNTVGDIFYGSNGYLEIGDEDADQYRSWIGPDGQPGPSAHAGGDHFANFIDAVRKRDAGVLNAPIQEGYISAGLVHLANASYRLGRSLRFDPNAEQVVDDPEADVLLRGTYREPFVVAERV